MNSRSSRRRLVAESWFTLSPEDQKEALAVAAAKSGWPANLLEKDIWVVWPLQTLGTVQQLLETLTFKGGTSLSKAYGLIDRFSEDVDLTLNIQHLWPEVDLAPAVNPSQADKRRKDAERKLKQWVREIPLPLLQAAAAATGVTLELVLEQSEAGRRQPPTIVIHYQPLIPAPDHSSGYVRPTVRLEFGAHSTGQPHGPMPISCEAATHLAMLDFPAASPLVMDARHTFLEKAAAIRDRPLAVEVVQHKEDFWRATDADGQPINYGQVINGQLQLVPTAAARQALESDYRAMTDSGMLRGEIPSFPELLERIALLEQQCNAIARSLW